MAVFEEMSRPRVRFVMSTDGYVMDTATNAEFAENRDECWG